MKKSYDYVNGRLIGYSDENGYKTVLTDALGNITGEVDESGELTYQARYSPLGKTNSSSGSSTSGFGWLGARGYKETGLSHSSHYVRARHYSKVSGGWTTVDLFWPDQRAYGYVDGRITSHIDPSGLQASDDLGNYMKGWQDWWEGLWGPGGPTDSACKTVNKAVCSAGNSLGRGIS